MALMQRIENNHVTYQADSPMERAYLRSKMNPSWTDYWQGGPPPPCDRDIYLNGKAVLTLIDITRDDAEALCDAIRTISGVPTVDWHYATQGGVSYPIFRCLAKGPDDLKLVDEAIHLLSNQILKLQAEYISRDIKRMNHCGHIDQWPDGSYQHCRNVDPCPTHAPVVIDTVHVKQGDEWNIGYDPGHGTDFSTLTLSYRDSDGNGHLITGTLELDGSYTFPPITGAGGLLHLSGIPVVNTPAPVLTLRADVDSDAIEKLRETLQKDVGMPILVGPPTSVTLKEREDRSAGEA